MKNKTIFKYSIITLLLSLLIQFIGAFLFVSKYPDVTVEKLYDMPYLFYTFLIPFFANAIMSFFLKDWTIDYKKVICIVFVLQILLDIFGSSSKEFYLHFVDFGSYILGFYFGLLFNSTYKRI